MTAQCPKYFPWLRPWPLFPKFFMGQSTLWICVQNLKSVAVSLPQIIGVPKIGQTMPLRGYAHALFSDSSKWIFVRMDPIYALAKFEVRPISFTRFWVNMGSQKNSGTSCPHSLLAVPEIFGDIPQIVYAYSLPYSLPYHTCVLFFPSIFDWSYRLWLRSINMTNKLVMPLISRNCILV